MRILRSLPPFAYIISMFATALGVLLATIPFAAVSGAPASVVAVAPPAVVATAPLSCLSARPSHSYASHKFDRVKAGPGSNYKESKNAQGPSAVPVGMAGLGASERLQVVKTIYTNRLCGGKKYGGDKKLFQLGVIGSDVNNLTAAPTHRHMNPNATISRPEWRMGLDAYLTALRWDKSYLKYEKLTGSTWTTIMIDRPGQEPLVKAVRHSQPKSWYLYLAVTQPDGALVFQRKRLACNFQDTYSSKEDVPVILKG